MDIKSILGYSNDSPFIGEPYIDIHSNMIDMSNTPIDLIGIDNKGNKKKMKAGRKNPYIFEGNTVREVPMQMGGNPYQQLYQDLYKNLFSGEEDYSNEAPPEDKPTAPAEDELPQQQQPDQEVDDADLAMQLAMSQDEYNVAGRNPYAGSVGFGGGMSIPGTNPYSQASPLPSDPARYAFQFFQNKGIPSHVAAGIVGSLVQESGNFRGDVIDDTVTGDNGHSHGLAQWQGSRWKDFLNWSSSNGLNPKDINTQLEFTYQEALQRGDLQKTLTAKNTEDAAYIFAKNYENCLNCGNKGSKDIQHRIGYAKRFAD